MIGIDELDAAFERHLADIEEAERALGVDGGEAVASWFKRRQIDEDAVMRIVDRATLPGLLRTIETLRVDDDQLGLIGDVYQSIRTAFTVGLALGWEICETHAREQEAA